MKWVAVLLLASCVSAAQNSQLSTEDVAAFDKLHAEYSTCAAYFNIAIQCTPKGQDAEATERLAAIFRSMTLLALERIGWNAGLSPEARRARLEAAYEEQSKFLGETARTSRSCIESTPRVASSWPNVPRKF